MKKIQLLSILLVMFLFMQKHGFAEKSVYNEPLKLVASISAAPSSLSGAGNVTFTVSGLFENSGVVQVTIQKSGLDVSNTVGVDTQNSTSGSITFNVSSTASYRARIDYVDSPIIGELFTSYIPITVNASGGGGGGGGGGSLTRALTPTSLTICKGSSASISAYSNGQLVSTAQWYKSEEPDWGVGHEGGGTLWTPISSTANPVNDPDPVNENTKYRAYYAFGYSNEATVTINETTIAGTTVVSEDDVCDNGQITLSLSGHRGQVNSWKYQKEINNDNNWSSEQTASTPFNVQTTGTDITKYRIWAMVQNGVCSEKTSTKKIVTVAPKPSIPAEPVLSPNTCGSRSITLAIPGDEVYYWVSNITDPENNNTPFYSGAYRTSGGSIMSKKNGCWSSARTVNINYMPTPTAGTLSSMSGSLLCYTASSVTIRVSYNDDGISEYLKWQKDGNDITGFEGLTDGEMHDGVNFYKERIFSITETAEFTAVFTDASYTCEAPTNTLTVEFKPLPNAGTLVIGESVNDQHICDGDNIVIDITGITSGNLTWQSNENGAGWESLVDFSPSLDTQYRVIATQPGCTGSDISNTLIVNVATESEGGNVAIESGQSEYCETNSGETNTGSLELLNHEGSVIRWEMSINGGDYNLIDNTLNVNRTTINYSVSPIAIDNAHTTYTYRAVVKSGTCQEDESTEKVITVYALPQVYVVGGDFSIFVDNASVPLSARLTGEATDLTTGEWDSDTSTNTLGFSPGLFGIGVHSFSYTYTDTDTDPLTNCTGVGEVTITVEGVPDISYTGADYLQIGEAKTLSVPFGYASYQWFRNDVTIDGATLNELVIDEVGIYAVLITNTDGYQTTTEAVDIISEFDAQDVNFVATNTYLTKISDETYTTEDNTEISQSTTYYDGLGRPMQTVNKQGSPDDQDIVQPIAYDQYGRQVKGYLPFVSSEQGGLYQSTAIEILDENDDPAYTGSPHQLFYGDPSSKVVVDTNPFSETVFEPSPLNRPIQQYGPGAAWSVTGEDRPITYAYEINTTDEVRLWTISVNFPTTTANYAAGELYKNSTTDEEDHQVIEFVDKQGRTVLKRVQAPDDGDASTEDWADTYYVYDDLGNLRFVLPPEAIANLDQYNNQ